MRFDVKNDDADMRLDVDPNESISTFLEHEEHHDFDGCMRDAFELFIKNK